MCIIIGDEHQFIDNCLIPLDACALPYINYRFKNLVDFLRFTESWRADAELCEILTLVALRTNLYWSQFLFSSTLKENQDICLCVCTKKKIYNILTNMQGGRGYWSVYYTSPQSFIIRLSSSLDYQLWRTFIEF